MKRIIDISDDTFNILKNMVEANCVDPYSLADIIVNKSIPLQEYEFLSTLMQSVMTTEQLKEVFQKIIAEKNRWIPVSEGLPKRNGVYNVTRKLNEGETIYFISDACYFDGQNTWHDDIRVNHGRSYLTDVIAWMPRPEPFIEKNKEILDANSKA